MSFEGHYEVLCASGHLSIFEVHNALPGKEGTETCRCGEDFIWWNLVNETNGLDENGFFPGETHFEPLLPEIRESCPTCRHMTKVVQEATFSIPEDKGHRIKE